MKNPSTWLGIFLLGMGMVSCAPLVPETPVIPVIVQFSFATQPWLPALQDCAGGEILAFEQRAIDFQSTDNAGLLLRLGGGSEADTVFQIGVEELIVISHPENPIESLMATEVQEIFLGGITNWADVGGENLNIQVWVFPAGEDIEQIFMERALSGIPITTYARLASSPEIMLTAITEDRGAIGLLSGGLMTEAVKILYSIPDIPVLALIQEETEGNIKDIISCLQK